MNQKNKISDRVAVQLKVMIAEGVLKVGDKLPPERELAQRLNVSRPSLREAKQLLTSKGLLVSRQGGGTYISKSLNAGLSDPLMELLRERPEFNSDILEVRHALDSEAAYYAALRANPEDKKKIVQTFDRMTEIQSFEFDSVSAARADADFHLSITEASHNIALLHITRSLYEVLQNSIEQNLQALSRSIPKGDSPIQLQHENIKNAVINGDVEGARLAAEEHMNYVEESMQSMLKERERSQRFKSHASILKD
jgi:DNA-binding FadR family transcriptional regulator